MSRVIQDSTVTEFYPLVGLRSTGDYVKGKVIANGETRNHNPFVTLSLIDLNGSTSKSVSKGVYQEVEVVEGDLVQVVGVAKQLHEKLPQLVIGEIVTITFLEKKSIGGGKAVNIFKVEVE